MDIATVSTPPVTTPNRPVVSGSAPVQETPAVTAPAQTNTPGLPPSNADAAPSADKLARAVNQVNDSFRQKGLNLYAEFEKDKATGVNVVKIVDKKTNETVNQIPIKAMLAFAQSIDQQQSARGKLFNTTV